jgi:hypothetical protein
MLEFVSGRACRFSSKIPLTTFKSHDAVLLSRDSNQVYVNLYVENIFDENIIISLKFKTNLM